MVQGRRLDSPVIAQLFVGCVEVGAGTEIESEMAVWAVAGTAAVGTIVAAVLSTEGLPVATLKMALLNDSEVVCLWSWWCGLC